MSFPETAVIPWGEIVTQSSTKRAPLGTRGVTPDGRSWRYAQAGADTPVGVPVVNTAPTVWSMTATSDGIGPTLGTTISTTETILSLGCSAKAETVAISADTYADGYLFTGSTGRIVTDGQFVQVKSHPAVTASSTCEFKVTLYDGQHLISAGSCSTLCFGMVKNPYKGVVEATKGAQGIGNALGVTPIAVTSGYYYWLCTWGPCPVEAAIASTLYGTGVAIATDTATTGAAHVSSGMDGTHQFLGHLLTGCATVATYYIVDLQVAP